MVRKIPRRANIALLILIFVLGACTALPTTSSPEDALSASDSPPSFMSTPATRPSSPTESAIQMTGHPHHQLIATPSPTPTPPPTSVASTPTPTPLPQADIVDNLWEWVRVAGPSKYIMGSESDGEFAVWEELWSQPAVLMIQEGDDGRELHQAPAGWHINDARITEEWVVLVEFDEADGDYNLWAYELAGGGRTLLESWAGEPYQHQVPLIAPDGQRLAWSTTLENGRSCLRIGDLAEDTQFDAICSHDDSEVLDWPYLRWPILTYQKQVVDPDAGCRTIYTLELPDGEPRSHANRACEGFRGAADEALVVWTEMSAETSTPWRVPIYGQEPEGEMVNLGLASAGAVAVCEGRAYWLTKCSNCPDEFKSWMPGEPVEVIYRSPDEEGVRTYIHTRPHCHGRLVAMGRTEILRGTSELLAEILVARGPEKHEK